MKSHMTLSSASIKDQRKVLKSGLHWPLLGIPVAEPYPHHLLVQLETVRQARNFLCTFLEWIFQEGYNGKKFLLEFGGKIKGFFKKLHVKIYGIFCIHHFFLLEAKQFFVIFSFLKIYIFKGVSSKRWLARVKLIQESVPGRLASGIC